MNIGRKCGNIAIIAFCSNFSKKKNDYYWAEQTFHSIAICLYIELKQFQNSLSLKLLVIFPTHSRSHYILGNELIKDLAKKGHDVTFVSAYSDTNPSKNYMEIVVPELVEQKESKIFGFFC